MFGNIRNYFIKSKKYKLLRRNYALHIINLYINIYNLYLSFLNPYILYCTYFLKFKSCVSSTDFKMKREKRNPPLNQIRLHKKRHKEVSVWGQTDWLKFTILNKKKCQHFNKQGQLFVEKLRSVVCEELKKKSHIQSIMMPSSRNNSRLHFNVYCDATTMQWNKSD